MKFATSETNRDKSALLDCHTRNGAFMHLDNFAEWLNDDATEPELCPSSSECDWMNILRTSDQDLDGSSGQNTLPSPELT
jgi:hypothetical protein